MLILNKLLPVFVLPLGWVVLLLAYALIRRKRWPIVASLVLLDADRMTRPYAWPGHDPHAIVVQRARADHVDTVISRGRVLMEQGRVLTVDATHVVESRWRLEVHASQPAADVAIDCRDAREPLLRSQVEQFVARALGQLMLAGTGRAIHGDADVRVPQTGLHPVNRGNGVLELRRAQELAFPDADEGVGYGRCLCVIHAFAPLINVDCIHTAGLWAG